MLIFPDLQVLELEQLGFKFGRKAADLVESGRPEQVVLVDGQSVDSRLLLDVFITYPLERWKVALSLLCESGEPSEIAG